MNANKIISDDMTLEEKLAAIDAAMESGKAEFNKQRGLPESAPVDPADLLMCEGCQ